MSFRKILPKNKTVSEAIGKRLGTLHVDNWSLQTILRLVSVGSDGLLYLDNEGG